ncbi:hypothetical protein HK102_002776, partial [Quaeritorhiza haematococci]
IWSRATGALVDTFTWAATPASADQPNISLPSSTTTTTNTTNAVSGVATSKLEKPLPPCPLYYAQFGYSTRNVDANAPAGEGLAGVPNKLILAAGGGGSWGANELKIYSVEGKRVSDCYSGGELECRFSAGKVITDGEKKKKKKKKVATSTVPRHWIKYSHALPLSFTNSSFNSTLTLVPQTPPHDSPHHYSISASP